MGKIYNAVCPDCGFYKSYFTGIGLSESKLDLDRTMQFADIEHKKKTLSERIQEGRFGINTKRIAEEHRNDRLVIQEAEGRRIPFYCPKCGKIKLRHPIEMSWYDEETDSFESFAVSQCCPACREELLSPEKGTVEIRCPQCGAMNAKITFGGMWD